MVHHQRRLDLFSPFVSFPHFSLIFHFSTFCCLFCYYYYLLLLSPTYLHGVSMCSSPLSHLHLHSLFSFCFSFNFRLSATSPFHD